jgi:NitT/TauT family transport system substrate-binding protein
MRLISKLACDLAAVIPAIALAVCSGGGSASAPRPRPEVPSITVDVVPSTDAAGIYLAEDNGYFARQGLTVTLKPVSDGGHGMGDLQTGAAQLVAGNYVSFIRAQVAGRFAAPDPANLAKTLPAKPISLRVIADTSQLRPGSQALYVPAGSTYLTAADLVSAHARVGVAAPHDTGSVLLGSLLTADGYPVNALKQVPETAGELPGLLAEHKISAAWLSEPFGTMAEQEYGAVPLADFDQGPLRNLPVGAVVGDTPWVRSHPDTVAAFLRALTMGQEVAGSDRPATEKVLVKYGVAPSAEIAATMALDSYPVAMDVPVMQRVADSMYDFGLITRKYDIAGMIERESGQVRIGLHPM